MHSNKIRSILKIMRKYKTGTKVVIMINHRIIDHFAIRWMLLFKKKDFRVMIKQQKK